MSLTTARKCAGTRVLEVSTMHDLANRYMNLQREIKERQTEMDAIKAQLKSAAEAKGKLNEKGSFVLEEGRLRVSNEKRVKVGLSDNAEDLLKQWGLFDLVKVETIDDDKVEQAFMDGKLTDVQLSEITERKESFALFVEELDDKGQSKRGRKDG